MADDYDRPHYHLKHLYGTWGNYDYINVDDPCDDDLGPNPDVYYVLRAAEYRALINAARDRHPTNHQPGGIDPAAYIASLPPYPADP